VVLAQLAHMELARGRSPITTLPTVLRTELILSRFTSLTFSRPHTGGPTITLEEQQGIVDEAHRQWVKVACAAHASIAVRQSIESAATYLNSASTSMRNQFGGSLRRVFMTFALAINKNPARQSVREIQKASFQRALKAGAKIAFAVNASGLAANRQGLITGKKPLNSLPWSNTE
jgi:hypothetical protein